jgi:histidinol-phosphate aminotransferase
VLRVRKCVQEVEEYRPVVTSHNAKLRLDLNESTTGCSPRVLAKLNSMDARTLALYPDRDAGEKLVAEFLGLDQAQVLLTNGADEGIEVLCRAFLESGDEMIQVLPAFSMYEIFAQGSGAKVVSIPADEDFAFPLRDIFEAINPRTRLIVITNPNNPTGVIASRSDILSVLLAAPHAAVLVDEAYFEFCGQTVMDQVGKIANLFVIRTFSKAYGLAGLRLGILAGAEEHMTHLRKICCPFNINAFALECLSVALSDQDYVNRYVRQTCATREWLTTQLKQLGFKCWASHGNFVLSRFGERKGPILDALRARGIELRDRSDCEGCVRLTIGTQQEMEFVLSELKLVLAKLPATQVAR